LAQKKEKRTAGRHEAAHRHRAGPLQRKHHRRPGPACLAELQALGVSPASTSTMCGARRPGSAGGPAGPGRADEYDALIALGCIIRGETYHFELVANESGAGVSRIALDYQLPVANAILTTENLEQAVARQTEKGRDAARVAVEMANLLDELA
jgi:6,7-dimethyl-8-ribityllumazine synthase